MKDYALLPRPVKDLLRQSVGRNVIGENWWRLRFAAERFDAERAEHTEVSALAAGMGRIPSATVSVVVPTYRRPERLAAASTRSTSRKRSAIWRSPTRSSPATSDCRPSGRRAM